MKMEDRKDLSSAMQSRTMCVKCLPDGELPEGRKGVSPAVHGSHPAATADSRFISCCGFIFCEGGIFMRHDSKGKTRDIISMEEYLKKRQAINPTEHTKKEHLVLMKTKHCLRDYAGICLKNCKDKRRLFLVDERGTEYRLQFDCKNCIMHIEV